MTRPSDRGPAGGRDGWEQRAADLASEVQRWLIRRSARNMRDELGDQVRRAFRGADPGPADVWEAATTEPPQVADEAPECAWCPVCRAARRLHMARGQSGGAGSVLTDAADVMTAAIKEVFAGVDSVLSYRPSAPPPAQPAPPAQSADAGGPAQTAEPPASQPPVIAAGPADDHAKGPEHGPDHRS